MTAYLLGQLKLKCRRRGVPLYWAVFHEGLTWFFVHDNMMYCCYTQREAYAAIDYLTRFNTQKPIGVKNLGVLFYDPEKSHIEEVTA